MATYLESVKVKVKKFLDIFSRNIDNTQSEEFNYYRSQNIRQGSIFETILNEIEQENQ